MKKVLCIVIIASLSITGHAEEEAAQKNIKWYVSGALGYAGLMDSDYSGPGGIGSGTTSWDANIAYSLAGGAEFTKVSARAELEIWGQNNDGDGDDPHKASIAAFMLNGYYDFQNKSQFIPYLLAGVGFANYNLDPGASSGYTDGSTGVGAFQLGAGVGYAVAENWIIDLKYKYFMTSDPEIEVEGSTSKFETECSGHQALVGVRYIF